MFFLNTNIQISPCILSKVRYATGIKEVNPTNKKKCSHLYWEKVINTFLMNNLITTHQALLAKNMYNQIFNI